MAATEPHVRAASAVDDLYRRHVGDVYRYTYAVLGNHADAEDVTQTTFVNALRALERGEEPRNAGNWLLVIAHNLVRQRWRQAASRPAEVELAPDVAAGAEHDDIELDGLVKALQRIPPAQREAIVMRELEGRSYREISELLSLSTSALETLLFRARRSLAEELENVVTCQTAELAISKRLDGRLGRKERRRLAAHLEECAACNRLSDMQARQRRAFKGLAVLPLPLGLALFKGAPAATAAVGLPTIGSAGAGGVVAGSSGTATAFGSASIGAGAAGGGVAAGGAAAGGAAAGGTLIGTAAAKVAAVVVAAGVATGVGYEGVKAVRDTSPRPAPAKAERAQGTAGAAGRRSAGGTAAGASSAKAATPTPPVRARGSSSAPGRLKQTTTAGMSAERRSGAVAGARSSEASRGKSATAQEKATPTRRRTGQTRTDDKTTGRATKSRAAQNEEAPAAKAHAAARKLARDSALGSAAATGKSASGAAGNGSSPTGSATADGKAKRNSPSTPSGTSAPAGSVDGSPDGVSGGVTQPPEGLPADATANGKGREKQ